MVLIIIEMVFLSCRILWRWVDTVDMWMMIILFLRVRSKEPRQDDLQIALVDINWKILVTMGLKLHQRNALYLPSCIAQLVKNVYIWVQILLYGVKIPISRLMHPINQPYRGHADIWMLLEGVYFTYDNPFIQSDLRLTSPTLAQKWDPRWPAHWHFSHRRNRALFSCSRESWVAAWKFSTWFVTKQSVFYLYKTKRIVLTKWYISLQVIRNRGPYSGQHYSHPSERWTTGHLKAKVCLLVSPLWE